MSVTTLGYACVYGREDCYFEHKLKKKGKQTSILRLNCPSFSSIVSLIIWMAALSLAMPSFLSSVVVVMTYWGGAIRLIWEQNLSIILTPNGLSFHL